jgi:hypothetical protein
MGYNCKRRSDEASFYITFREFGRVINYTNERDLNQIRGQSATSTSPTVTGRPVGERFYCGNGPTGFVFSVAGTCEQVLFDLTDRFYRENGKFITPPRDRSADERFAEELVREALAKGASKRLSAKPNLVINGRQVSRWEAPYVREEMVDLDQWAQAKNITLTRDDPRQERRFSYQGRQYVLVLAAKAIKVGSEWQPMNEIVMLKDGARAVPLAGLP